MAVKTYAIKRLDATCKWDAELVENMVGTPQRPDPTKQGRHIPIRIQEPKGIPAAEGPQKMSEGEKRIGARRVYMSREDFVKYGYTPGCRGCLHAQAGLPYRGHTESCRSRMEGELERREEGKRRMKAANDRLFEEMVAQERKNPGNIGGRGA